MLNTKQYLATIFEQHPFIEKAVALIQAHGGRSYLVGGAVRDMVLGLHLHDLDIEVHNLEYEQLVTLLNSFGTANFVGKSFGVLKMAGASVDWALPRTDTAGRKPVVFIDPRMGITEALRRRDLTMNAMALELTTGEFFDPFHGLQDIQQSVLRSPDLSFFKDDPLRFYRVMQFIGRFEMYPDPALHELCSTMDIAGVSLERKEAEFEKLLLLSRSPSLGIRWLLSAGKLSSIAPELFKTCQTEQDPSWHPEGSVFEHLMQTVDAAASTDVEGGEKLILLYAALCHDLGKATTTAFIDGRLRSPGHAEAGVSLTRSLLRRITRKAVLSKTVETLVLHHMAPGQLVTGEAKLSAYRRLAVKLAPLTTMHMLALLALADRRGRNGNGHEPLSERPAFIDIFIQHAQEAGSFYTPVEPLLYGRDIADFVKSGPAMGRVLREAYTLQLEHGITDKDLLKNRIRDLLESKQIETE